MRAGGDVCEREALHAQVRENRTSECNFHAIFGLYSHPPGYLAGPSSNLLLDLVECPRARRKAFKKHRAHPWRELLPCTLSWSGVCAADGRGTHRAKVPMSARGARATRRRAPVPPRGRHHLMHAVDGHFTDLPKACSNGPCETTRVHGSALKRSVPSNIFSFLIVQKNKYLSAVNLS